MFVEPCCVERQLPKLLREANGIVMYQTSGDVTIKDFMKAVSSMAGPKELQMTLCIAELTEGILKSIGYYMKRRWVTEVRLLTQTDQTDMVNSMLPKKEGCKVIYGKDDLQMDGLMAFEGKDGIVVLQGHMIEKAHAGTMLYAGCFSKAGGRVDDVMKVINSKINLKADELVEEVVPEEKAEEGTEGESEKAE